ncbi:MAG: FAD binding domain-containing protein [Gemmatimonadetes bacterium]|nr:FAD binding domain-containing protein [Gemmatimonadota bacterium]
MAPLRYRAAETLESALTLIGRTGSRPIAGGTDLLVAMEAGLDPATEVIDITRASELTQIVATGDGGLRIGGAARLEDIAGHPDVAKRFNSLALASAAVGTPTLRAMGTLGGNLCQRPRCWYLRSRIPCFKNGGTGCPAEHGENQYHAVFGGGPCHAAHPSDPAVALLALDAVIVVRGADTTRRIGIEQLYADAATNPLSETTLAGGEIIEAIELAPAAAGGAQLFTKLMQRGAGDFATVSLAGVKRLDGTVRLVFGGVGPAPLRVNPSVEEDVESGELDQDSVDALAERAMYDAKPLELNGYKVQQAAALLRRAMLELSRA